MANSLLLLQQHQRNPYSTQIPCQFDDCMVRSPEYTYCYVVIF